VSDNLNHAAFLEQLKSKFFLQLEGAEAVVLELSEVSPLQSGPFQEGFSLVFQGPVGTVYPQRSYRFDHERLGSFEMLIVPIKSDADGVYYEAVFNRLIEAR
jgi:Domain of unknown function (DUF6916)